jgi:cytochrome oxidase Cu insertion factor (SCO1/SenC/PrrC family)
MGKGQRIVTGLLWGLLVVVMLAVVGAGLWPRRGEARTKGDANAGATVMVKVGEPKDPNAPLERMWAVPAFSYADANGNTVTNESLKGRPWVAAFVFTNCTQACPMMVGKLRELQDETKGSDLRLVSFTLDPQRDTPEVLRDYGKRLGADGARWLFLRGDSQEAVMKTAQAMKVAATVDKDKNIGHGDWFLLVDADGWVRGHYRSSEADAVKQLADDAKKLAK